MNIEDFLKEGGLDIDTNDPDKKDDEEEKKEDPTMNTDPDDKMTGYLYKSSIKVEGEFGDGDGDIFGTVLSGIGGGFKIGLKLFAETI